MSLLYESIWGFIEGRFTPLIAEVVGLTLVFTGEHGRGFVDRHTAHRIFRHLYRVNR